MENVIEYYLVEVNERGEESALAKFYSNSFTRTETVSNAFKFDSEEQAKEACHLQNMLAKLFKNDTVTYYVKQSIERTKFDENGELYVEKDVEEATE